MEAVQVAAKLIPDTDAFLMTNDNAVVLFFRGTEPSKLIEWASDGEVTNLSVVHHPFIPLFMLFCFALLLLNALPDGH